VLIARDNQRTVHFTYIQYTNTNIANNNNSAIRSKKASVSSDDTKS